MLQINELTFTANILFFFFFLIFVRRHHFRKSTELSSRFRPPSKLCASSERPLKVSQLLPLPHSLLADSSFLVRDITSSATGHRISRQPYLMISKRSSPIPTSQRVQIQTKTIRCWYKVTLLLIYARYVTVAICFAGKWYGAVELMNLIWDLGFRWYWKVVGSGWVLEVEKRESQEANWVNESFKMNETQPGRIRQYG